MSDIAIIQKATLYEMADAIIDTTERTESFKVSDMPRLIREDVYNKGYADGEANGTSEPIIYGTYLLRDHPSITRPSDYISYSLEDSESYGFYIVASKITYGNIHSIQFGDEGFIYIHFDRNCYLAYEGYWRYYDGEDGVFVDVPDERFRIIDIKTPITVPKDIYDMFMGLVDNDQEKTSFDIGKKAQYDEFWDGVQDFGKRTSYNGMFYQWGDAAFYPKYDLIPTGSASGMFQQIKVKNFKQRLIDCGVTLDLSKASNVTYLFSVAKVTHVPVINTTSASSLANIFYNCRIVDIEKLILKSDGSQTFSDSFKWCESLQNVVIEGTIGQNGLNLQWSDKLSRSSIESILSHLSTTTSGLSIALSLIAVNKAFETSAGANDGYNSEDFRDLVQLHNNWTINLA